MTCFRKILSYAVASMLSFSDIFNNITEICSNKSTSYNKSSATALIICSIMLLIRSASRYDG